MTVTMMTRKITSPTARITTRNTHNMTSPHIPLQDGITIHGQFELYTVVQKGDVNFQLNRAENVSNYVRML